MKNKLNAIVWLLLFIVTGLLWSLLQPFIIVMSLWLALFGRGKYQQYGINCWEGKDNLVSAQSGGDPDESLSSRLGKARAKGSRWSIIANKVDLVARELFKDFDHCNKSRESDEGKKQVTTH